MAGTSMLAYAQASNNSGLEEIIVTATKRSENLQNVPESLLAFTTKDIQRYGFKGAEDYVRFIPSLTDVSFTPGSTTFVFRGVANSATPYLADPTVGVYLDEQPLTTYDITPEVRPVDIQRIEALTGPQGTLYGASSESGTVRIITNKPDLSKFSANINVDGGAVYHGEGQYQVDGMVNIPIIPNTLGVRLVAFSAHDAGYIDNVLGLDYNKVGGQPVRGPLNNANAVKSNFNGIDWLGGRAEIKWNVNDKWSALVTYMYQQSQANGWNSIDPTLPGDAPKVVKFFPEYHDDVWHQLGLTIKGDLGFAQFLSSTSYFNRGIRYQSDQTVYQSYLNFATYYDPAKYPQYDTYNFGPNARGYSALKQRDWRITEEARLSHDGPKWKWTLGFFYQDANEKWDEHIHHLGYANSAGFAAWQALYGPIPPTDVAWHSNESNDRKDYAVFGEVTYSLTDKIDLIFGGRYYDTKVSRIYFVQQPQGRLAYELHVSAPDSGFLKKFGIKYHYSDDKMAYFIYSEGFRAGGINRSRGNPVLPRTYKSDNLINYEAGVKTQWLDKRLQVNLTGYHDIWKNMQLESFDPSYYLGGLFQEMVANIGDAEIDGIDFDVTAVPFPGANVGVSGTYLITDSTSTPLNVTAPGLTPDQGLHVPKGRRLPLAAKFNLAAYVQYSWPVAYFDGNAYARFQYSYTGPSYNYLADSPEPYPRLKQAAYDIGDVRVGFQKNSWEVDAYVKNIWDERPDLYNSNSGERFWGGGRILTSRPRSFGVQIHKSFD